MAGETLEGRRVEPGPSVWGQLERAGDYCPLYHEDGRIKALWFILPGGGPHDFGRISGQGGALEEGDPEWEITEDAEGRVTVSPSIQQQALGNVPYWHGYLEGGVWRSV